MFNLFKNKDWKFNYDLVFYMIWDNGPKEETDKMLATIIARINMETGIFNIGVLYFFECGYKKIYLCTKTQYECDYIKKRYHLKSDGNISIRPISPYPGICYTKMEKVAQDDGFTQYIPVPSVSKANNEKEGVYLGTMSLKNFEVKQINIFYHNDHDGIFAAAVMNNYIRKLHLSVEKQINLSFFGHQKISVYPETNLIPIDDYSINLKDEYLKVSKENDGNKLFIFLDYSFTNKDNLKWLDEISNNDDNNILIIDHHISSLDLQKKEKENLIINIDTSYCGAVNTWRYLYPDKNIPKMLQYVDSYDTWKHNMPNTQEFHYGLLVSSPTDALFNMNSSFWNSSDELVDLAIERGKHNLDFYDYENKNMHLKYSFEFTIRSNNKEYKCLGLNRRGPSKMFLDEIEKYDIVCPFYFNGNNFIYSLFTVKEDIDCEYIAKRLGGGGHRRAAGFCNDSLIIYEGFILEV